MNHISLYIVQTNLSNNNNNKKEYSKYIYIRLNGK